MDPNAGWWETDVAKKGDRKRSMTSTEKNGWRNVCWVDLTFADKLPIGSDEIDYFEQAKICLNLSCTGRANIFCSKVKCFN